MTEQPSQDFDAALDDPDDDTTAFGEGRSDDADTDAADEPDPEE